MMRVVLLTIALTMPVTAVRAGYFLSIEQILKDADFCALVIQRPGQTDGMQRATVKEYLHPRPRTDEVTRIPALPQLLHLAAAGEYILLRSGDKWYGYRVKRNDDNVVSVLGLPAFAGTHKSMSIAEFRKLLSNTRTDGEEQNNSVEDIGANRAESSR